MIAVTSGTTGRGGYLLLFSCGSHGRGVCEGEWKAKIENGINSRRRRKPRDGSAAPPESLTNPPCPLECPAPRDSTLYFDNANFFFF